MHAGGAGPEITTPPLTTVLRGWVFLRIRSPLESLPRAAKTPEGPSFPLPSRTSFSQQSPAAANCIQLNFYNY